MVEQSHLAFFILVPVAGCNSTSAQSADGCTLTLATVDSIGSAVELTRDLLGQGITAIELSAAFGDKGVAAVRDAAGEGIAVGRVHYEI